MSSNQKVPFSWDELLRVFLATEASDMFVNAGADAGIIERSTQCI